MSDNTDQRCRKQGDLCRYDLHSTCLAFNVQKDCLPFYHDETGRVLVDRCPEFVGVYAQKLETLRAALVPLLAEHLSERVEKQVYTLLLWTKKEQAQLNGER